MYEDDATWACKNGKCTKVVGKGGVGEFETLQECEDSNCEERARPGGYGGGRDNSMSTMDTQALNEQIVELKKLMVYNPNLTLTEQTKVVNKMNTNNLNRIVRRVVNESHLLTEGPYCNPDGADPSTVPGCQKHGVGCLHMEGGYFGTMSWNQGSSSYECGMVTPGGTGGGPLRDDELVIRTKGNSPEEDNCPEGLWNPVSRHCFGKKEARNTYMMGESVVKLKESDLINLVNVLIEEEKVQILNENKKCYRKNLNADASLKGWKRCGCSRGGGCKAEGPDWGPGMVVSGGDGNVVKGGDKTKYPKAASKHITMKESDLINIVRRVIKEDMVCTGDEDCETGGPRARCIKGKCGHGEPRDGGKRKYCWWRSDMQDQGGNKCEKLKKSEYENEDCQTRAHCLGPNGTKSGETPQGGGKPKGVKTYGKNLRQAKEVSKHITMKESKEIEEGRFWDWLKSKVNCCLDLNPCCPLSKKDVEGKSAKEIEKMLKPKYKNNQELGETRYVNKRAQCKAECNQKASLIRFTSQSAKTKWMRKCVKRCVIN